ncbi:MAG: hypothetical protein Fur0043_22010 [Anaerolineales bacterium]
MSILLTIHSLLRWLIVILGALAVLKFLFGWLGRRRFSKIDRALSSAFSGLIDTQALLGLLYFTLTGLAGVGFPLYRIEHMATMLLAAVVAHSPSFLKRRGKKHFIAFASIAGTLFLIYLGVARLPGGWNR